MISLNKWFIYNNISLHSSSNLTHTRTNSTNIDTSINSRPVTNNDRSKELEVYRNCLLATNIGPSI
jgi:hypothetical protein